MTPVCCYCSKQLIIPYFLNNKNVCLHLTIMWRLIIKARLNSQDQYIIKNCMFITQTHKHLVSLLTLTRQQGFPASQPLQQPSMTFPGHENVKKWLTWSFAFTCQLWTGINQPTNQPINNLWLSGTLNQADELIKSFEGKKKERKKFN